MSAAETEGSCSNTAGSALGERELQGEAEITVWERRWETESLGRPASQLCSSGAAGARVQELGKHRDK